MKTALLFLLMLSASCKDVDYAPIPLNEQLKGQWVRTTNENWHYVFDDAIMVAWIHDFGSVITEYEYAYTCDGDTLNLTNLDTGNRTKWLVNVRADTADVRAIGFIDFDFKIRRE